MDINFKNGSKIAVSEDLGETTNTLTASGILEAKKTLEAKKIIGMSSWDITVHPSQHPTHDDISKMFEFYGINGDKIVQCPECEMISPIRYVITHLNDLTYTHTYSSMNAIKDNIDKLWNAPGIESYENHAWTFKQIGKWLEGLGY